MKIALLGIQGQIGNRIVPYLKKAHHNVWGPNREDLNLYDTPLIYNTICKENPNLIINTAAYTNVDGAENHKNLANKINYQAVREIAKAAKSLDIPLIHFSTDYVFDGNKQEKYKEEDSPHPLNYYGRTKLAGDEAILTIEPKGIIFRTSWVYDWRRTNFFLKMKLLMQPNAEIHIINDQFGVPNSAGLLAKKVYEYIIERNFKKAKVMNLVCSESTSWFDFAKIICTHIQQDPLVNIIPISTAQYVKKFAKDKLVATRPHHAVLDNSKAISSGYTMPNWDTDFINFIQNPYG